VIEHHPEQLEQSQFKHVVHFADSLRSGLSKMSLKALSEYVKVYELTEKEIQDTTSLLLRKAAEASEFIRINAFDALVTLGLKYPQLSVACYKSILLTNNQATARLAISKVLGSIFEEGFASQDCFVVLKGLLADKDSEVRQAAREAVEQLCKHNSEAEELV
jgi:3-methyladenine DNA glycosylase AlkD